MSDPIIKELRESAGIVALAVLALVFIDVESTGGAFSQYLSTPFWQGNTGLRFGIPFVSSQTTNWISFVAAGLAVALGLKQTTRELSQGTYYFLLQRPLPRNRIFCVKLAVGTALVWGLLAGWGFSVVGEIFWPRNRTQERLKITTEGVPLIRSMTLLPNSSMYGPRTYRTIDGQLATLKEVELLNETDLQAPVEPPGMWYDPVAWRNRIAGINDLGKPPVGWYLIGDDRPSGHALLAGYDMKTKQLVGYLGRNGFLASLPPEEE